MTTSNERRSAVERTRKFLVNLMAYPEISEEIRDQAYRCLKHYPGDYDMEQAAEQAPKIFGDYKKKE
jgi:hypothetical protein